MALENQRVVQVFIGSEILKHIEPGDFVISMRSFQGGLEWCRLSGSVSSAYVGLTPTKNVVPEFFRYLFKSEPYIQALQSTSNLVRDGQALRFENFAQVSLPLIPEDEQTQIAKFLDHETAKIDRLIEKQEALIQLLKEKRQAVISHAVTKGLNPHAPLKDSGIEWLGRVPAHWLTIPLARLVPSGRRITYGIVQPGEPDPQGRFMIRGQDYSSGWANPETFFRVTSVVEIPYRRARLMAGDLVMTIVGAGVGNTAVVPQWLDGSNITQTTARVAIDGEKADSNYVSAVLTSTVGKRSVEYYAKGAAQPGLNLEHVKIFPITLPPLEEQRDIADFIRRQTDKFEALVTEAARGVELLQERRTALISAAVTGKIDVRHWQPPTSSKNN